MDAALNEFMLVGVNIVFGEKPAAGKTSRFLCEFQVVGQLPLEDFKKLRKACRDKELSLRCDFGNFIVLLKSLEYDSVKESFSLLLVEKP